VECVDINGKEFLIDLVPSRNKHAHARLKDNRIVISIPSRWPSKEKEMVSINLRQRAIRAIERGRWKNQGNKKIEFSDGQRVSALGMEFEICFVPSSRFRSKVKKCEGRTQVQVGINENRLHKYKIASRIVKKRIVENLMPMVLDRVNRINNEHFQATISKIRIRDTSSRWGSCSRNGSINLSLKLLFMPESILEYVIVHELAHTKYRNHGIRFWALVEKIIPDHKERRAWLREKGGRILERPGSTTNECPTLP
jgi:predicted metal-dependent hydrolase